MKTVKEILRDMTDTKSILRSLRGTLMQIDPEFPEVEKEYTVSSEALENAMGSQAVRPYLDAREEFFARALIFIGWQGFRRGMDASRETADAGSPDYEELHRERCLGALRSTEKARKVQESFTELLRQQPEEVSALTWGINAFYAYLETVGYKLAHYFGFRLAGQFLPYVVPGCTEDLVSAIRYKRDLEEYLHIDLSEIA